MATIQSLIDQFTAAQKEAEAANEARYKELLGIASKVEGLYGADYGTGFKAELERTKASDIASGMQGLVSSGLGGTTRAAGLSSKWEEQVGTPARLKLEDIIAEKQFAAQQFKAGIIERRTDQYPDYNAMMQAVSAQSSIPQSTFMSYGSPNSITSLPGREAPPVTPAAGQPGLPTYGKAGTATTGTTTPNEPITMGQGYGPMFQTQADLAKVLVQPTITEQTTANLQKMYPQMYNADGTLKAAYGGK